MPLFFITLVSLFVLNYIDPLVAEDFIESKALLMCCYLATMPG